MKGGGPGYQTANTLRHLGSLELAPEQLAQQGDVLVEVVAVVEPGVFGMDHITVTSIIEASSAGGHLRRNQRPTRQTDRRTFLTDGQAGVAESLGRD